MPPGLVSQPRVKKSEVVVILFIIGIGFQNGDENLNNEDSHLDGFADGSEDLHQLSQRITSPGRQDLPWQADPGSYNGLGGGIDCERDRPLPIPTNHIWSPQSVVSYVISVDSESSWLHNYEVGTRMLRMRCFGAETNGDACHYPPTLRYRFLAPLVW